MTLNYDVSASCQEALPAGSSYHIICNTTINPHENDKAAVNFNFTAASLNFINVTDSSLELMPESPSQRTLIIRNTGNESIANATSEIVNATEGIDVVASSVGGTISAKLKHW